MESKNFKVVYEKDENGNDVKRFVPVVPPIPQYGDYMKVKEGQIQEAKDELLNRFLDTIKELAKDDKFWLIKRAADFDNSTIGRPVGFADDDVIVGYKFPNADMK